MTAIMQPPFNSQYYSGLILVVIYCGSLSRMNFDHGFLISIFLVASYQTVGLVINPIPMNAYISNNFFLVVAMGMGLFLCLYHRTLYPALLRRAEDRGGEERADHRCACRVRARQ